MRESVRLCLAGREVQDKLRPPITPGHVSTVPGTVAHWLSAAQFTTQQDPTGLSDHYFSQINLSGRRGGRGSSKLNIKLSHSRLDVRQQMYRDTVTV